ncbi:MAG: hypothetical protein K2K21_08280, partial [Lachnospiraceae bacterium]|nr:hypothetical protein [Lachnospiraceae bacterium]
QTDVDFYYNRDTGMFILPDSRELTDDELRQYIDFSYKRDYSLQAQYALENPVSEENENNYGITDLEVPEEHKEFIQACLMVLGINDSELTNLHIEEVHDDAYMYSYQADAKILSITISPDYFKIEEYESEEMKTNEGTDFMKAIDETQNYKSARKALDMMCGDEWTDASAWYYCQSIPEGYLRNDKYAYIFVNDKGKDLWLSYRYGETYPCKICNIPFEIFTDNLERVEEHGLYERLGVEIEDHLIEIDIETGKAISDN